MKKTSPISTPVMKRIISLEKNTILRALGLFIAAFSALSVAFFIVSLRFVQDVRDLGTSDVLTLFWEDHEIIADYWREVLSTFWLEAPVEYIYILLGIVMFSIIILIITAKKRKLLRIKAQKLASYEKSSTLVGGGKQT